MSILQSGNITVLLAYLKYAEGFPDFPKPFVPLDQSAPGYVVFSRQKTLIVNAAVTMGLSTIIVLARLISRKVRGFKKFGWDDCVIIPATVRTTHGLQRTDDAAYNDCF
jgi:hypothetical protein